MKYIPFADLIFTALMASREVSGFEPESFGEAMSSKDKEDGVS